jgi:hypothetical protein
VPKDYWDQVSQHWVDTKHLTYLPHAFVLAIRPSVRDCYGSQVLGAMDSPPSEEYLLIDEPWHLHILSPQNWSQSSCLSPQSYIYGIQRQALCLLGMEQSDK